MVFFSLVFLYFWQIEVLFFLLEHWGVFFHHPPNFFQLFHFSSLSFIIIVFSLVLFSLIWEQFKNLLLIHIPFHLWKIDVLIFFTFCPTFQFTSSSCIWKNWKCIPSSNHLLRIHKTNHVNFKIDENGEN